MVVDGGLEDEMKNLNTVHLHLGAFVLSNKKRNMNNSVQVIIGFDTNDFYYTDTNSLYIQKKHWDKLNKAGLVGKNLLQGKNDFKDGIIFSALLLAPKRKYCSVIIRYENIDEHKTYKNFTCVTENLDRKDCFKM